MRIVFTNSHVFGGQYVVAPAERKLFDVTQVFDDRIDAVLRELCAVAEIKLCEAGAT
jgi:hypothetical protein